MKTGFDNGAPVLKMVQGNPTSVIAKFREDKPTIQGRLLIAGNVMLGSVLSSRLPHPADAVRYGCSLEMRYGPLQALSIYFPQNSDTNHR